MKFGRVFRNHLEKTLPGWRVKYLRYKLLKRLLKNMARVAPPPPEFQVWFVAILTGEIEKFNDFYVGKEEDLIIRFQALKEAIERVKSRENDYGESEFSEVMNGIFKDLVMIHGEMVLLKSYSSLNFAGLIKILKKYDKRTGAMLSIPFTTLAFHQPFFMTQPLTRLVRDCEILFPLEAEAVELASTRAQNALPASTRAQNASLETLLLVEETGEVYRSTIATISTIEGLRGPSSTYSNFSMSNLFGSRENNSTGAENAENSP